MNHNMPLVHHLTSADVAMWHRAWDALLEAEKPITLDELAFVCEIGKERMKSVLCSLSIYGVPVYEDKIGRSVFYGICRPISHAKIDELIGQGEGA